MTKIFTPDDIAQFGKGRFSVEAAAETPAARTRVSASTPYNWKNPQAFTAPQLLALVADNQGSSESCIEHSLRETIRTLHFKLFGEVISPSDYWWYMQIFLPGGEGTVGTAAANLAINEGWLTTDQFADPNPETEQNMEVKVPITPIQANDALANNFLTEVGLIILNSPTMEETAQAVRDYVSAMILVRGSNEGWTTAHVRPPLPGEKIWGHGESLHDYNEPRLIEGAQEIPALNHWTLEWGDNGWNYFDQEYFTSGNIEQLIAFDIMPLYQKLMTALESIRTVFGPDWKPASAFTPYLKSKGILGAVRVANTPTVYTLGWGGGIETPDSYHQKFNTLDQDGIVGIVTPEQAKELGIKL